eukprot:CAMPEP_0178989090 /NCGR_PEP_ID=MMETSP0795-20121207/4165_1 /TAXON_ID=88552 /ORGANISM="Amoebophrya sp., Strain Ameob2" /LENGTH=326 /DNA_ID=CAMNT_0020680421 /DNA_START=48 /DNA_END=1028 /DNA_ORIENTATION=+
MLVRAACSRRGVAIFLLASALGRSVYAAQVGTDAERIIDEQEDSCESDESVVSDIDYGTREPSRPAATTTRQPAENLDFIVADDAAEAVAEAVPKSEQPATSFVQQSPETERRKQPSQRNPGTNKRHPSLRGSEPRPESFVESGSTTAPDGRQNGSEVEKSSALHEFQQFAKILEAQQADGGTAAPEEGDELGYESTADRALVTLLRERSTELAGFAHDQLSGGALFVVLLSGLFLAAAGYYYFETVVAAGPAGPAAEGKTLWNKPRGKEIGAAGARGGSSTRKETAEERAAAKEKDRKRLEKFHLFPEPDVFPEPDAGEAKTFMV